MTEKMIPPPTPEDLRFIDHLEALYNEAEGEFGIEDVHTSCAEIQQGLIRLLAFERAQNAERGELLKALFTQYPHTSSSPYKDFCNYCSGRVLKGEPIIHDPDCLAERARRAGVPV